MRGFTFSGPGRAELSELPDPTPGPGEILFKVESNTVCGTDLRIMRGEKSKGVRVGVVLGHEVSGTIAELGGGTSTASRSVTSSSSSAPGRSGCSTCSSP